MLYTKREHLTCMLLEIGQNKVSLEELKIVLLKYPSNMIYCESQGKLVGIISTGDIYRALKKGLDKVDINRNFMCLRDEDSMKARAIFKSNQKINALPVVRMDGILMGDYTRWDDLLELECNLNIESVVRRTNWDGVQNIAIVRPGNICKRKQYVYEIFQNYLKEQNVIYIYINYCEVSQYLDDCDLILFIDENEMRAYRTILEIEFGGECNKHNIFQKYIDFVQKQKDFSDLQFKLYLKELSQKGIKIVQTTFKADEYYNRLINKIDYNYMTKGRLQSTQLFNPIYKEIFDDLRLPKSMYEEFFDDLYSEEYAEKILNIPFAYENKYGVFGLKDCQSQYYNVINSERYTEDQPDKYERTIYFVGPCYIYGLYVEDKNTIESFLQKHLNQSNNKIKVVNYGCIGEKRIDCIYMPRIATIRLRREGS